MANWMLDEVGGGAHPSPEKQQSIVQAFATSGPNRDLQQELGRWEAPSGDPLHFATAYALTHCAMLGPLVTRALRVYWRSPEYTLVRSLLTVVFAVVFGSVYFQLVWPPFP